MKRAEIERKFDEIVAFAEIEKFMDTPVKHYSSGCKCAWPFLWLPTVRLSAHAEAWRRRSCWRVMLGRRPNPREGELRRWQHVIAVHSDRTGMRPL